MFDYLNKKQLTECNPSTPTLKYKIELYKEWMHINPVPSFIEAPSYKLAIVISRI